VRQFFFESLSFFGLFDAESPVTFLRTSLGAKPFLGEKSGDMWRFFFCVVKLGCPLLLNLLLLPTASQKSVPSSLPHLASPVLPSPDPDPE
jgi:hypothetical protein